MIDQVIPSCGDPATDREMIEEMRRSYESSGMKVQVTSQPGGFRIVATMEGIPTAPAQSGWQATAHAAPAELGGAFELGGPEVAELKAAAARGDLTPCVDALVRARAAGDWDDYDLVAGLVGSGAPRTALDQACSQTAQSAELRVLRATHSLKSTWDARGRGTADTITNQGADTMVRWLDSARQDLVDAARLDPHCPTPHAMMIEAATLHEDMTRETAKQAFNEAIVRHPTNLVASRNMLRLASEKWGGSHEEQLQVARFMASRAPRSPDLFGAMFFAHIEGWFYIARFDEDEARADAYVHTPAVQIEVNRAFDSWLTPAYQPRRVSPRELHLAAFWYFMVRDVPRLKRVVPLLKMVQVEHPWSYLGDATTMWMQAAQMGA